MSLKKLDKKQVPQFAALCVLSGGLFGYFVIRIVTPTAAAAGTRVAVPTAAAATTAAATPATGTAPAAKAGATPGVVGAAAGPDVSDAAVPPTPNMRDPFVVGYAPPKTASVPAQAVPAAAVAAATVLPKPGKLPVAQGIPVANIREAALPLPAPPAPALPSVPAGFAVRSMGAAPALPLTRPAPLPPAPPKWTVTGVLLGGAGQVAILRDGGARRFVRAGDSVDGVYRVVDVTRTSVVLRHGVTVYALTLGGAAPASGGRVDPAAPLLPAMRRVSRRVAPVGVILPHVVLPHTVFSHVVLSDPVVLTASGHVLTLPPPQAGLRFLTASSRPAGPQAVASLVPGRTPDGGAGDVGEMIGH